MGILGSLLVLGGFMDLMVIGNALERDGLESIDDCIAQTKYFLSHANEENSIYIKYLLADLFILKGCFKEALDLYSSTLSYKSVRTHVANTVLNLKYELNIPIEPIDIVPMERKLSKYGLEHIEEIVPYFKLLIKEIQDISKKDLLQYFGMKYKNERHYSIGLFNGYDWGAKAEMLFYRQPYAFHIYCFYAIDEFRDLCLFLSRRSENLFRSSVDKRKLDDIPITENTLQYIHNIILQYKKYAETHFKDYTSENNLILPPPRNN
jgi:hypothetical protein